MTPEQLHREITSGRSGAAGTLGQDWCGTPGHLRPPRVQAQALRHPGRGPGEPVRAESRFAVPASSYISNDGENLYVGRYSEKGNGELFTIDRDARQDLEAGKDVGVDSVSTPSGVNGAPALSSAVSTQSGKVGDDLADAEGNSETICDGLRWCADGYEISDHESFDALESFSGLLGLG